jgi:transforming growth factor-beta-induced protein
MKNVFALGMMAVLTIGGAASAEHRQCAAARGFWAYNSCQRQMVYYTYATPRTSPVSLKDAEEKTPDIVDTAVKAGSFKTLVAAVKAAGLVETLKGKGPLTVFAPTDDAFSKLPEGTIATLLKPENKKKLQAILTYHVVAGEVLAKDVVKLKTAKTVNGKSVKIQVKNGKVYVDGAQVVKTDIKCGNGVIHVINKVILP